MTKKNNKQQGKFAAGKKGKVAEPLPSAVKSKVPPSVQPPAKEAKIVDVSPPKPVVPVTLESEVVVPVSPLEPVVPVSQLEPVVPTTLASEPVVPITLASEPVVPTTLAPGAETTLPTSEGLGNSMIEKQDIAPVEVPVEQTVKSPPQPRVVPVIVPTTAAVPVAVAPVESSLALAFKLAAANAKPFVPKNVSPSLLPTPPRTPVVTASGAAVTNPKSATPSTVFKPSGLAHSSPVPTPRPSNGAPQRPSMGKRTFLPVEPVGVLPPCRISQSGCTCDQCRSFNAQRFVKPNVFAGNKYNEGYMVGLMVTAIKSITKPDQVADFLIQLVKSSYRSEYPLAALDFDINNRKTRKARLMILRTLGQLSAKDGTRMINDNVFISVVFNKVERQVAPWKSIFLLLIELGYSDLAIAAHCLNTPKLIRAIVARRSNIVDEEYEEPQSTISAAAAPVTVKKTLLRMAMERKYGGTTAVLLNWYYSGTIPEGTGICSTLSAVITMITAKEEVFSHFRRDPAGRYMIMNVAHNLHWRLLGQLDPRSTNINVRCPYGATALMHAVRSMVGHKQDHFFEKKYRTIKKLLSLGADPNIPEYSGERPLFFCLSYFTDDYDRKMLATGGVPTTSLIVEHEMRRIARLLIKYGATLLRSDTGYRCDDARVDAQPREEHDIYIDSYAASSIERKAATSGSEAELRACEALEDQLEEIITMVMIITPPDVDPSKVFYPSRHLPMAYPLFNVKTGQCTRYQYWSEGQYD